MLKGYFINLHYETCWSCRFEETHKYFAKDLYEFTPKRTKDLETQLFRVAVYREQIAHLCAMVSYNFVIFVKNLTL